MTVDETFFANVGKDAKNYAAGVILPDGSYELIKEGHLHMLLDLMPMPNEQVWELIPKGDSPLFWLIEHTGCVITDENSTVGLTMNPAQERTYKALTEHGVIADKYFDLTGERKRARETYATGETDLR
ncbi:MAG: hypothetical protein ACI4AB_08635 [Acetatifactor sp.]